MPKDKNLRNIVNRLGYFCGKAKIDFMHYARNSQFSTLVENLKINVMLVKFLLVLDLNVLIYFTPFHAFGDRFSDFI